MHSLTVKHDVFNMLGKQTYWKGDRFLVDDVAVAGLVGDESEVHSGDGIPRMLGSCVTVNHWPITAEKRLDTDKDYNGKSILLARTGGFGDLLFLTPTIAEIKRRWPECSISVSCLSEYAPALHGNPHIAHFFQMPLPIVVNDGKGAAAHYDWHAVVSFEDVIETNPSARTMHAVDCCALRAGFVLEAGKKKMEYYPTEEEKDTAGHLLNSLGVTPDRKIVGIQFAASSDCRTYPAKLMNRTAKMLADAGHTVLLFGAPGKLSMTKPVPRVHCLPTLPAPPSFRVSAALLCYCDLLIAPDSSLAHVAGALEIPTLALHAAFPGHLRHAYHHTTEVIEPAAMCAPCFHHQKTLQHWPKGGPCEVAEMCVVMAMITPERIVARAGEMLCRA